jgi:hypothetical protein
MNERLEHTTKVSKRWKIGSRQSRRDELTRRGDKAKYGSTVKGMNRGYFAASIIEAARRCEIMNVEGVRPYFATKGRKVLET